MHVMLSSRPDIYLTVEIISRFQSNPTPENWIVVKHIIMYLQKTKDYILVYSGKDFTHWVHIFKFPMGS